MNKKVVKIILIVIAVMIYFNIGYLVAHSTSSTTLKTPATQIIWKIINFYDVASISKHAPFEMVILFWPLAVVVSWLINLVAIFSDAICWIFTGGFWRLIGFTK